MYGRAPPTASSFGTPPKPAKLGESFRVSSISISALGRNSRKRVFKPMTPAEKAKLLMSLFFAPALVTALLFASEMVSGQVAKQAGIQPDGSVVLPTNQVIRPVGRLIQFEGRPTAIAIRPDG